MKGNKFTCIDMIQRIHGKYGLQMCVFHLSTDLWVVSPHLRIRPLFPTDL